MPIVPTKFFLVKGVGVHKEELVSFELALREAGIAQFNLVNVSSIIPPDCKMTSPRLGLKYLSSGQILFLVLSQNKTNEANRLISSSIGCAFPLDKSKHGYLSEYHSFGLSQKESKVNAENLASQMLATTLGLDSKYINKALKTCSISQSAIGKKNLWVTTITSAVFVQ